MGSSLPGGGEADWPGYWLLSDMEADTGGGEANPGGGGST